MTSTKHVKLGVNIDHVATLRQARRGHEPDVRQAALEAVAGGADGITIHLREDRRHIQDSDVYLLKRMLAVPLNLEMSVHPGIVAVARRVAPQKVCFVPERRQELTTEGGLDVIKSKARIAKAVSQLQQAGSLASIFIDPERRQIEAAFQAGADFIELHTGRYANLRGAGKRRELYRLKQAALFAHSLGLGVNAGHGLNYENVRPIARLPHVCELNIGHAIVSRSVFTGLKKAVRDMRRLIQTASRR